MDSLLTRNKVAGVITAGLLLVGGPTAVDLALLDTVALQPIVDEQGIFQDAIREYGSYTVEAKDFAGRDGSVGYCAEGNCIRFTPASVSWDTGEELKSGPAILAGREVVDKKVKYAGVYGSGFDMDISVEPSRFSKVVTIDALDSLGTIPEKATTLDLYFALETNLELVDGSITSGYQLSKYSRIVQPQVWGSVGEKGVEEGNTQTIAAEIRTIGDTQFLVKHIPVEFLKAAQYPIHTDADIVYGSSYAFQTTQIGSPFYTHIASIDTDQFVECHYRDSTTALIDCSIGTVTGGVISYGATSTASANDSFINNGSESEIDVCKVATDKFAVVYPDDVLLDDGYVRVGSVSGSTITFGTALEFLTTDMEAPSCAQMGTDKIAIAYNNETNDQLEAKACTVSGTTVSCGTANVMDTDTVDSTTMGAMGTDKFVVAYTSATALEFNAVVATVSGTTITDGTPVNIKSRAADNGADGIIVTGVDANNFAGMYYDNNSPFFYAFFAATTSGTTIGGYATSTAINVPTNGPDLGGMVALGDNTVLAINHDFEGATPNNRDYGYIGIINWSNLAITKRDRSILDSRSNGHATVDVTLLDNGYVVYCGVDQLESPTSGGYCNAGSIVPQVDTYTATNVASTSATLNGEVTFSFDQDYTGGFVYGIDSVFTATTTGVTGTTTPQVFDAVVTGLTTFEEYGYKAFASTSIYTGYDTDVYQFFTADISTSTPVVAADNHVWDLATFDAGTHATTTQNPAGTILFLEGTSRFASTTLIATSTVVLAGASTSASIDIPLAADENDLVIVYGVNDVGSASYTEWVTSDGWTNILTDGGGSLPGYSIDYKIMGATPDTSVTVVNAANNTRSSKYIIEVWRNVDIYNPIDNSYTLASAASGMPDSPSHTTLTASSTVITVGFIDDVNAATATPPTGYTNFTVEGDDISPDPLGATVMVASKILPTAGAENPGVFGGTDTDDWKGVTFALRPKNVFADSGYWIAPSWDIGSISSVDDSWIEYSSTTVSDTRVVVKTAVNTSSTVPPALGDFATSTSAGAISGISASDNLSGKYLWILVQLFPSSDTQYTPTFLQYIVGINDGGGAAVQRRILFPS